MLPLQYPVKLDPIPVAVLDPRSFETSPAYSSVPAIHASLPAVLTYQKDKCHRHRRLDGKVCLRDLTGEQTRFVSKLFVYFINSRYLMAIDE